MVFKPIWAVAFFFVVLLSRRWRVCVAMVATATLLALATLPLVGWHSWLDWLHIGKEGAELYKTDPNWIFLSRDLVSIPRRWLIDSHSPPSESAELAANIIGCVLLALILEPTIRLAVYRPTQARASTGPIAAVILLGGVFSCFHFMYYDVLLSALPVLLLLSEPAVFLKPRLVALVPINENPATSYFKPGLAWTRPTLTETFPISSRRIVVFNSVTLTLIALLFLADHLAPVLGVSASISVSVLKSVPIPQPLRFSTGTAGTPWVTFCLVLIWAWCGWLWAKTPRDTTGEKLSDDIPDGGSISAPAAEFV